MGYKFRKPNITRLQIHGEYYQLEPITDMLYITAFSDAQFVLMCWSHPQVFDEDFAFDH